MKSELPMDASLAELSAALDHAGAAVLVAETGAGKTTRVPPLLSARHPSRRILVLEPRRIAARAAARRMAAEDETTLGQRIGFSTRFERAIARDSEIEVLTDGLFLRRIQEDPELRGVAAVVLDEFHERSINLDLSLAFLVEVRASLRPDLEVVVMSATIDPEPVADYLGGVPILRSPGRTFPIAIEHDRVQEDEDLEIRVARAIREATLSGEGNLLVFLPGMAEINRVQRAISDLAADSRFWVLRLHGELSASEQDSVFRSDQRRKIVLATNIAETSLTIPGVRVVIDSGRARIMRHDADLGLDRLELARISRAAADQRAGRAGREAPGQVRRLWTLADERSMAEADEPELARVDLANAVLEVLTWGATDPRAFNWFQEPEALALESSLAVLEGLGAIEAGSQGLRLTAKGRRLAQIPAPLRVAAMLLAAEEFQLGPRAALAAALLVERDPLPYGARRALSGRVQARSDLLLRLDLIAAGDRALDQAAVRRIKTVASQFARLLNLGAGAQSAAVADEHLLRALLAGFPDRVAKLRPGTRRALMCGGRGLSLLDESVLRDEDFFIALRLAAGRRGRGAESPVTWASAIEESWLEDLSAGVIVSEVARFDEASEKVKTFRCRSYLGLVLEERVLTAGDAALIEAELLRVIQARPDLILRRIDGEAQQRLRARIAFLAEQMPELGLRPMDDQDLLELIAGQVPGQQSIADLVALDLVSLIRAELGYQLAQTLDREAPERFPLPGGRSALLHYEPGRVRLSARVQHLFGLIESPRLAGGRVPVVVELLAPNQRPVQVTADLAGFWRSSYQLVRKDLRGRYPKHDWPEVPPGL